jgi:glycosyltransferase involved in cell wall biosynthesis
MTGPNISLESRPRLHILQSKRLLPVISFVESPSVKRYFRVTKSDQLTSDADLMFCQTFTDPPTLDRLLESKVPSVIHLQGDVWYEMREIHHNPELLKRINAALEKAKLVVCISRFLARIAAAELETSSLAFLPGGFWGMDHTRFGVMPALFPTKPIGNTQPQTVVMQISLNLPRKYAGIPVFFDAIGKWRGRISFLCVGDLQGQSALAVDWRDQYGIQFMDFTEKWPELLCQADLYVHPSLYDTWGRSVAEAMCAGLPVLTFPRGGVPEISAKLRFCDPDAPEEIAGQFDALIDSLAQRRQVGAELHREALAKTETHRDNYARLLFQCLQGTLDREWQGENGSDIL